jgi:four helix bundle suffix protein
MRLTDVARASLAELKGDYEFWLLKRKRAPWKVPSPEAQAVFDVRLDPNPLKEGDGLHESGNYLLAQQAKFAKWLEADDPDGMANAMLILLHRVLNMLNRQLDTQGETFRQEGGIPRADDGRAPGGAGEAGSGGTAGAGLSGVRPADAQAHGENRQECREAVLGLHRVPGVHGDAGSGVRGGGEKKGGDFRRLRRRRSTAVRGSRLTSTGVEGSRAPQSSTTSSGA